MSITLRTNKQTNKQTAKGGRAGLSACPPADLRRGGLRRSEATQTLTDTGGGSRG